MNQITILFADKHPLIRNAWSFLLKQNPRFHMLATCESGKTAIQLSKTLNPDIVIIDTCLGDMSGLEATQLIRRSSPSVKVIGLSYYLHPDMGHKILLSGAQGCLSKMSYPEEIFKTITEVHSGKTYICKELQPVHKEDALLNRLANPGFNGNKIITMSKPRLQQYSL
jgi:DNA-binding NarL/FixJ family response regulator